MSAGEDRLGDVETDCRIDCTTWILRIGGALAAPLEDEEKHNVFELSVTTGFDSQTAVEGELVLRLAGLLWRPRSATAIDTGFIQMQATRSVAATDGRRVRPRMSVSEHR